MHIPLISGFVLLGGVLLGVLDYNFDEGVGIQQALLIQDGLHPFRDYFQHQTPAYVYTLALFTLPAPDALFAHRLLSLLATGGAAFALHSIARRLMPAPGAMCAVLLYLVAPLQFYGLLALPHACVLFLSTLGMRWLVFDRGARKASVGAALLVLAILFKPLAIPVAIASAIAVLAAGRIRDAVFAGASVAITAGVACALFHVLSDGVFTEVILLQAGRLGGSTGFDQIAGFELFQTAMAERGISSPLGWSLHEHANTFLALAPTSSLHLLILIIAALPILAAAPDDWRGARVAVLSWLLLPAVFFFFVWKPVWDHYFIYYLPPACLLGGAFLQALWSSEEARSVCRAVVIVILGYAVFAGSAYFGGRLADFSSVPRARLGGVWLTFDPFVNLLTGSEPACGMVDPFNVYGENSLVRLSKLPTWDRFQLDRDELIECLRADPSIRIGIGSAGMWFLDPVLEAELASYPVDRLIEIPESFRTSASRLLETKPAD